MNSRTVNLFALTLCTTFTLTACQGEKRQNPILEKPTHETLNWIDKNKTAEIEACTKYWAFPKTSPHSELVICADVAQKLADEMNTQGFVQGAVEDDIYLPTVWRELHEKFTIRAQHKADLDKQNTEVESQPDNIFGNFPTNTKW